MNFCTEKFTITKKYADELVQKQQVFIDKTKTKKTIFLTMVTTFGVTKNAYYKNNIQNEVTIDALFI